MSFGRVLRIDSSSITPIYYQFWDSIACFMVMCAIATLTFASKMQTIYEAIIACTTVHMCTAAALTIGFACFEMPSSSYRRYKPRILVNTIIGFFNIVVFNLLVVTSFWWGQFVDEPCFSDYYVIILRIDLVVLVPMSFIWLPTKWQRPIMLKIAIASGFLIEFVYMWLGLSTIVSIRNAGAAVFGTDYGDNAWGFGQVIAIGFVLQTVVQLVVFFFRNRHSWRSLRLFWIRREENWDGVCCSNQSEKDIW